MIQYINFKTLLYVLCYYIINSDLLIFLLVYHKGAMNTIYIKGKYYGLSIKTDILNI